MINNFKTKGEWKMQLKIAINFISSEDSNETFTIHTNSDRIEIMIGNETDEIIGELFRSILQRYQKLFEESMKGSNLVSYKCHQVSLNCGGSNIDSPKWL